jgi:hypothetical protein
LELAGQYGIDIELSFAARKGMPANKPLGERLAASIILAATADCAVIVSLLA